MRQLITLLGLALVLAVAFVQAAPVEVVYTGESCACPTQLGYQLNVPNPPKPKKYGASEYGYRVEKPVQTKAKISYSFDFTVEQPRTPPPPKYPESKLYAKVDRVTVNKGDCAAKHTSSCSCTSCSSPKPRYVVATGQRSPNAIRRRRELRTPGSLIRRRLMRQQQLQERPPRYVKLYHKDLTAQQRQKQKLFGLRQAEEQAASSKTKRKTKKTPAGGWLGLGRRLSKRDIKGEFDLLERERAQIDLTAPEIIQFMPETLNPNFQPGQCHMGCGAVTAVGPPPPAPPTPATEAAEEQTELPMAMPMEEQNNIPSKRSAFGYYPLQIPSPLGLPQDDLKYVDDSQLRSLLSTTSVPDPLERGSTPLQFAGDLESVTRRGYASPLQSFGGGYPVEHVSDSQLNRLISEIVNPHPHYLESSTHYPEPNQKRQTTDFLKKLIDGRLGGWGFESTTEPEHAIHADYSTAPAKTYGYNSHVQNGYSVDTYNVPPISEYLRAWF
ncbi:uncharacterized protein DMAD_01029 [Drosophila madeirensis]|uniref:Uncharacterized protein n=1 Tax=Drosophila madeirensis TaxID=30013 RepID=A0AAU9FZD0_DROMD